MSPGQTGFVPGTNRVCPRDKPRFSSYFTQRKPSLSLGQTQFVPGTFRGRRAADRVYVFFRFLTSACDRGKRLQRDKECSKTPASLSILVPSGLADPDHPLNTPL